MNNVNKITGFSLVAGMFLIGALATSSLSTTRYSICSKYVNSNEPNSAQMNQTAAQNMSNQTVDRLTKQSAQMNQTAGQSANKTSTNQTSAGNPKLTTSDIQDIRKTLDEVRKDIADGKATEAFKANKRHG